MQHLLLTSIVNSDQMFGENLQLPQIIPDIGNIEHFTSENIWLIEFLNSCAVNC